MLVGIPQSWMTSETMEIGPRIYLYWGWEIDDIMMQDNDHFFYFTINPKVFDSILLKTMKVYAIHCNVKYEKW